MNSLYHIEVDFSSFLVHIILAHTLHKKFPWELCQTFLYFPLVILHELCIMEKNFIITQEELTMKYGFGIDLGGTTVKIAYFNEAGKMLEKWEIPTDTSENGIRILPDIAASVRAFLTER